MMQLTVPTYGEQLGPPELCLACGIFVGFGKMASFRLSALPPQQLALKPRLQLLEQGGEPEVC